MTLLILVFAGTGLAFLGLMVLWALSLMVGPFIGQAPAGPLPTAETAHAPATTPHKRLRDRVLLVLLASALVGAALQLSGLI